MVATFHEIQFPADVSVGAVGGPEFRTTILTLGSGEEKRNVEWSLTRAQYNIGTGLRERKDFEVFQQFFYARQGRAYGFRFKDWSDYQIGSGSGSVQPEQKFTVGGGVITMTGGNKTFQIYKAYASGGFTFIRPILKPVSATVEGTRKITVNDVEIVEGVGAGEYQIDYTTGLLTFGTALSTNDVVEIVYLEYDVPVRFDIDKLDMNMAAFEAGEWLNIPIVELKNAK
jgi:uncharacterized protein (TIGR02217 family)